MMKSGKITHKEYWRSLADLADKPEYKDFLSHEDKREIVEINNIFSRRNFLTVMAASIAMAGLAGCRRPVEKIVPYVSQPDQITPGVAEHFATTMPFGLSAFGLVVESHEGRPTKIEGNPKHPSTAGASNVFVQASILDLYDPDRSKRVLYKGEGKEWNDFVSFWRNIYPNLVQSKGQGLALMTAPFSSPTLARLTDNFRTIFPEARLVVYEPVSDENIYNGIKIATGSYYQPIYHYDKADVILSLDSDFLMTESENISSSAGFAAGRRVTSEREYMNRLFVVENGHSLTGSMADHRLRLEAGRIGAFTAALANQMKAQGLHLEIPGIADYSPHPFDEKWLEALAKDLIRAGKTALVVAGSRQSPGVHALVCAINSTLGSVGQAVFYREIKDAALPNRNDFASLTDDLSSGAITTLVMLGGNPVYNAPVDLGFRSALAKVQHTIHLSSHTDETSRLVEWHLPQSHYLEYWGDARAVDGTMSIIQPLIAPMYGGRSTMEVLNLLVTGTERSGYDIIREQWQTFLKDKNFEKEWRLVLHDGVLADSALPATTPPLNSEAVGSCIRDNPFRVKRASLGNLEIVFQPSPAVYDGRFANNAWLQELPDSMTKVTWDNAAFMSFVTARDLGVNNNDIVKLRYKDREMDMPVYILPGAADYSVSLWLGYGRTQAGNVGNGVGFDVYGLRTSQAPDIDLGLTIALTGRTYVLASTQRHWRMENRPLIREATLEQYRRNPEFASKAQLVPPLESIYTEHKYDKGYQWGMAIDLTTCTGCNACIVACQSENNGSIVGKEQVIRGREMHWIRIDRYFSGSLEDATTLHQVVTCQQCENAPCEEVCPVGATVHDPEGINGMTYNRCIGTRYCSNNCPYKVRRFNFFNYTKSYPESIKLAQNPDVTVRSRGVMEKCMFCIQRINRAKINAKEEGRTLRDGEFMTACQQACPTQAIAFGNINDPDSNVSKVKRINRNYAILSELLTRPRNTYLARLRNPHPLLDGYTPTIG